MSIREIIRYVCTDCLEEYEEKIPVCTKCEKKFYSGKVIGVFEVLKELNSREVLAECLLCGFSKEIYKSNMRVQKSCGCKPRHVTITTMNPSKVRYHCSRCNSNVVTDLPVFEWCCADEEI